MKGYIGKRLLQLIPILIGVTFLSFALMRLAGSDAVTERYEASGQAVSEEVMEEARRELGLDKPFLTQYLVWLKGMVTGDMGESYVSGRDVFQTFISKLPATILLTVSSVLLTVLLSVPLGIWSAVKQNRFTDYLIRFLSFVGNALPNFFVALLLMYLFSIKLGWLPASGFYGPQYWILPSLTIGFGAAAFIMRMTRSSMLEVIRQDYIRTARAKGQSERVIITRHALKNALIPIITSTGLQFGFMLGGSILAESVFAISGLGKLILDGIKARNYPVVQGGILFIAFVFSFVNLLVDVIYAYADPRIKSQYVRKKRGAK